ncbi:MAG TPA: peptidylprolyl isomerase [Steroidobacteraceae bacterium]|nr:peptidylprolyl isomerase [Steroidobacteraceae bacterium]
MRAQNRTLIAACTLAAALACLLLVQPAARAEDASHTNPEVRVTTNMGSFVIELRPNRAPLTVANFLRYVRSGFYNNTLFHRVVGNFVIQGGGHAATPPYALKPTYPPIDNESGNGLQNKRGAVGLARAAAPDTGNSQFYINLVDNPELDPLPTRWGYAVFGKVVEGMSVVDSIGTVATGAFGPFKSDAPLKPVIIEKVEEITPPQLASPSSGTPAAAPPPGTSGSGTSSSGSSSPGTSPSGTPPSGASSSGSSSSGASGSASPPSGSPESSQPPAANPPAQPAEKGAKPPTPPTGAVSDPSSDATPPQTQPGAQPQSGSGAGQASGASGSPAATGSSAGTGDKSTTPQQ